MEHSAESNCKAFKTEQVVASSPLAEEDEGGEKRRWICKQSRGGSLPSWAGARKQRQQEALHLQVVESLLATFLIVISIHLLSARLAHNIEKDRVLVTRHRTSPGSDIPLCIRLKYYTCIQGLSTKFVEFSPSKPSAPRQSNRRVLPERARTWPPSHPGRWHKGESRRSYFPRKCAIPLRSRIEDIGLPQRAEPTGPGFPLTFHRNRVDRYSIPRCFWNGSRRPRCRIL